MFPLKHPFRAIARSFAAVAIAGAILSAPFAWCQNQPPEQQKPSAPKQQPDQASPDSGGPAGDVGPIAIPKKKDKPEDVAPPAPPQPKVNNPEGMPATSLRIEVPEVTVDVGVILEKTHQFVPGLKPNNFRVYEDGVQQKISGFRRVEAPITALLLCEFAGSTMSRASYMFNYDMLNAAWAFAAQLRPQDYVALMTYDMKTHIITDFTQDKRQVQEAIQMLQIPGFSERNLFDALYEAEDRLSRIEGRKYIVLVGSGRDTFSKITYDKILQKVKNTPDITIFTISTGGALRAMTEGRGSSWDAQMRDMDYLQADNEMRTFAKMTGGSWYSPRFEAEFPEIFGDINKTIRSKYELVYHPSNPKQDGSYRKLRVELVDDEGQPLRFQDEKHHPLKYDIIARDGYRARPEVE